MGKGLMYCGGQWQDSFCIAKLVEAIISGLLILAILIQMILDIKMRGAFQFGFTQVIQSLMLFTLICNLTFSINHDLVWFYYLESFFYDCYFCTLIFYMTYRIVQKSNEANRTKLLTLKICYIIIILGFFAIFLYSGLSSVIDCKQVWFLVIDIIGLIICAVMILFGYRHHQKQSQRFLDFRNVDNVNNPMAKMWTIILINLFCQLVQLTQSTIFLIQAPYMKCHFSKDQTADVVIKLLFSLFSLHLSFVCTVIMFHLRRANQENYSKSSNNVRMIQGENQVIELGEIWKNQPSLVENDHH